VQDTELIKPTSRHVQDLWATATKGPQKVEKQRRTIGIKQGGRQQSWQYTERARYKHYAYYIKFRAEKIECQSVHWSMHIPSIIPAARRGFRRWDPKDSSGRAVRRLRGGSHSILSAELPELKGLLRLHGRRCHPPPSSWLAAWLLRSTAVMFFGLGRQVCGKRRRSLAGTYVAFMVTRPGVLKFWARLLGAVQTRPILYGSISFQVKKVAGSLDKFSIYRYLIRAVESSCNPIIMCLLYGASRWESSFSFEILDSMGLRIQMFNCTWSVIICSNFVWLAAAHVSFSEGLFL
jgi:hypothetical protein